MATRALVLHPRLTSTAVTGPAGGPTPGQMMRDPNARLEEAVGLTSAIELMTAHAEVVTVAKPRPGTLFGSGQIERYANLAEQLDVDVVVIDHGLTPVQQRNLERRLNAKAVSYTHLTLPTIYSV